VLSTKGLYCERDERVLFSHLDFDISAGRVLQVQGSNGSGKTTLLRILSGLNGDFEGEMFWEAVPLGSMLEQYRSNMFYLGHAPGINKSLTPMQNLRWFCANRGFADDDAIVAALHEFGLSGYEDIPCYQMSAGQQRRVSLARLPLANAPLWILDEPFTALDRRAVADLEARIADHASSGGAVILTTHHPLQLSCPLEIINLDERLH
jgi:heme exporter protein A